MISTLTQWHLTLLDLKVWLFWCPRFKCFEKPLPSWNVRCHFGIFPLFIYWFKNSTKKMSFFQKVISFGICGRTSGEGETPLVRSFPTPENRAVVFSCTHETLCRRPSTTGAAARAVRDVRAARNACVCAVRLAGRSVRARKTGAAVLAVR